VAFLLALNGSPVRGSSIDLLLEQVCLGFREAGGEAEQIHCNELWVKPCQSCGPEPTTGFCIFHDDMDLVYQGLERAHAIVVGSPIYFDAVSAQLKLVIDRCNCITMLVREGGGETFRPRFARTRRGAFITTSGPRQRYDMAERCVRGFLKWVGAKWEETLAFVHADNAVGSVAGDPELMARARALGRRLAESPPLVPEAAKAQPAP
jgi:multimeric flavodoxin WrbA